MNDAPERLGRYRIVSELGRGAMGVVYKGIDDALERTVAIKTILMTMGEEDHAGYLARFRQEAKALGGLNHPAIITVHDFGDEGDVAYMAMEFLDGRELRDLMRESRIAVPLAVGIAAQVAEGLAFAHARGVVHRDVKPANIMVMGGERAKLMDFGIARVRTSDVRTQTGVMLGSPKYMSPEQILGRSVDHRADIFSLGVVLYEMLAGAAPFAGEDINQLMYQVCNARPVAPSRLNPAVPEVLDLVVARALEKEPDARYQDAGALASDLRASLEAKPRETAPSAARSDTLPGVDAIAKPAATVAGRTLAGPGPGLGLAVSRRFDSKRALDRLARPRGDDRSLMAPTVQAPGAWIRLRDDRVLQLGVAVVLAAVAVAWVLARY